LRRTGRKRKATGRKKRESLEEGKMVQSKKKDQKTSPEERHRSSLAVTGKIGGRRFVPIRNKKGLHWRKRRFDRKPGGGAWLPEIRRPWVKDESSQKEKKGVGEKGRIRIAAEGEKH